MSEKEISREELKKHNDNKSVWIEINNDIYDVTAFLNDHPGGEEVLLEQAGKDGSEAFEDVGHSSDAREIMVKYKVGTLPAHERKANAPKTGSGDAEWTNTSDDTESSTKSWILPVVIGLIATVLYRLYFSS